ncbi:hypothetical protein ACJMK2_015630 [Sinanodonta woodiana]|uniref:Hexosyltransferase n=1 Tax=Sinanodonta woodiana TaxID=1069815 RepID=A0ABD3UU75_SINWO
MATKRKNILMLIPVILSLSYIYMYNDNAWIQTLFEKDAKHQPNRKQSIPAEKKLCSTIQENSTEKDSFDYNNINFDRIRPSVLSLDNTQEMSLDGRCSEKNDSKHYELVPGNNSWIPIKMCKPFKGPYYIKLENGTEIPYTNYTFMPLTFRSKYLLNNPNICAGYPHNLTFLILVHSAVQYFHKRKALRETWANPLLMTKHSSRLVFIVGRTENSFIQRHLEDEERVHRDIVQGDFIDDYHNLTHKAVLGHRWIKEHCQNTKFVLKVDDDVVINMFKLIEDVLPVFSNSSNIIACSILKNESLSRKGKWALSYDYFPGYVKYPFDFCPGAFALMTLQTSLMLFRASHVTPFIWLDDVYMYGILINIANIRLRDIDFTYIGQKHATKCFMKRTPCPMVHIIVHETEKIYFYWRKMQEHHKNLTMKYSYADQVSILDK